MFNYMYKEMEVNQMAPLVWAYIGDSVYEMYFREKMISRGIPNNTRLHKETTKYVKASAQAKSLLVIKDMLTEEETDIVRRARNTNSNTIPKNASVGDYKNATALEGLIGYLFLIGKYDRIIEIMNKIYENI